MTAPDVRRSPVRAIAVVVSLYAMSLALICLWPQHVDYDFSDVVDAVLAATGLSYDALEFLGNVLMFAPLGALGVGIVRNRATALLFVPITGLAISAMLEDAQAAFLPGRSGSTGDIIANTLGVIVGCLAVVAVQVMLRRFATRRSASALRMPGLAPLPILRVSDAVPAATSF